MRTSTWSWIWIGALGTAGGSVAGCNVLADDCDNARSCSVAGSSGSSGNGGATGNGGNNEGGDGATANGGRSGSSGTSGSSSSGGDAGTSSNGGGGSGEAGSGGSGGGCDSTKSPNEETCLVSDDFAVFVSPDGSDDNDGTQSAPLATLTKAVEVAAGNKLVLVCDATYNEHVSITEGARIYGGFACADWSAEAEKPLFKPTTTGPALKVDTVADDVLLESLSFEVGDAVGSDETALTAIVNASPKVTLRAVSLKAGKGKAGADGSLTPFTFQDAAELNGNAEGPAGAGGDAKTCTCQAPLSSTGGLGGAPVLGGQNGSTGQPDHGGGLGGIPGSCGSGGTGQDGTNAPASPPAAGASSFGTASASGWLSASGTDGENGQPGQGGGGGASRNNLGHGGGGGCGGCGGTGGTAGRGGGASIALLALNSPVVLESSTLTTADAGNGGNGAAGQAGQSALGSGGSSLANANSCDGGNGGFGGDGGAGGGAAGGISVGIVWNGATAPSVSADTTTTTGKAGVKGTGGVPGTNDGIAGVSQKILALN